MLEREGTVEARFYPGELMYPDYSAVLRAARVKQYGGPEAYPQPLRCNRIIDPSSYHYD